MNQNTILAAMAVCLLAGCANQQRQPDEEDRKYNYTWSKAGATSSDFSRDKYECETAAQQRLLMSQQAMIQVREEQYGHCWPRSG